MALTITPLADLGTALPDFELLSTENKKMKHSDFLNGKPLVVVFMCNHCPYVKAIEDRLIQLGSDLKQRDIHMVGICSNDPVEHPEDNFENLQKRFKEKSYSFTYLHDPDQKVAQKFGAVCTPDYFVYDNNKRSNGTCIQSCNRCRCI
jgi:peroxiredoxin